MIFKYFMEGLQKEERIIRLLTWAGVLTLTWYCIGACLLGCYFAKSGIVIGRGVTGQAYFSEGHSHFSWFFPGVKCFFPVANSHFGRPKTNFRCFQKWKAKKKKKKVITSFLNFSYFHFQFSTFLFQFSIFLLFFSIFSPFPFFPCLSFPDTSPKISRSEVSGGHSAPNPLPPPACYATGDWWVLSEMKEPKLLKLGVFWANYGKRHPICAKLCDFLLKMVYWWWAIVQKNGLEKVKFLKSGRHIHIQFWRKYPLWYHRDLG